jgi:hypothetical protein
VIASGELARERPGFARMELSPANYRDWKDLARSYEAFVRQNAVATDAALVQADDRSQLGPAFLGACEKGTQAKWDQ